MDLPTIYAHIAPDGRLLQTKTEPPVSWTTIGGKVYEYAPKNSWRMSSDPGFEWPPEGSSVVCKVLTTVYGEVPECDRYGTYISFMRTSFQIGWKLWGWKYLED